MERNTTAWETKEFAERGHLQKRPAVHEDTDREAKAARVEAGASKDNNSETCERCLVFPPFCPTAQMDGEHLKVVVEAVQGFLVEHDDSKLRLILMLSNAQTDRLGEALDQPGIQGLKPRLVVVTGDLVLLREVGARAQVLATPCDVRYLPKTSTSHKGKDAGKEREGEDLIQRVNAAAGPELESSSRLLHGPRAVEDRPFAVKLSNKSPLRSEQGISHIIQVLPPSSPSPSPSPSEGGASASPEEERQRWRGCYARVLSCFHALLPQLHPLPSATPSASHKTAADAIPLPPPSPSPSPSAQAAMLTSAQVPRYAHPGPASPMGFGWDQALYQYLQHPERHRASLFLDRPECLLLYDGFRKSKVHLLLLPKPHYLSLDGIAEARAMHLDRLRHLHALAKVVAEVVGKQVGEEVVCGYHAIPSLRPLHLHIISRDFDSPHLKNKKHWNTFTTRFFVRSDEAEQAIAGPGKKVNVDRAEMEALEKGPLRCHRCATLLANMPKLKLHIGQCRVGKGQGE